MRILIKFSLGLALTAYCLVSFAADTNAKPSKSDVRLLIDISGSMKKNDPNNLRIPALQLVTNLMPKKADAGVWAFGRYVNMMVPLAQVDENWQDKATKSATKINSAGLFTNIGGALSKASYGWTNSDPSENRSMILLTDGMVDISKDPNVNTKERNNILNNILPKLVKAGVTLHTIALSKNADHELLKTLSTRTDGWYQAVESAEELQKVFLKIFEQSAARDSLPLTDNQFNVDASIEEMTLLVFKQNPQDKTSLVTPQNKILDDASKDDSLRWFSTSGYDLITIKTPPVGAWKIDANVDPDNRVMVVSNLALNIAAVPNNLLAGEDIDYQVSLMQEGEVIDNKDFLNLVKARLIQNKQGKLNRLGMFFDSASNQFKQNFFIDNFEGVLELTLEVKSPTFERTRQHAVNIYGSPLIHQLTISNSDTQPHKLNFKIRDDIVKANSLNVTATIKYPDGEKQYLGVDDLNQGFEMRVITEGGDYSVSLDIKGQSILGRNFSISPDPIIFTALATQEYLAAQQKKLSDKSVLADEAVLEPVIEKPVVEKTGAEESMVKDTVVKEPSAIVKEPIAEPDEEVKDDEKEEPPVEEESSWTFWLLIGLAINIVLVGLGVFAWKFFKSKDARNTASITDELDIDDEDEVDDELSQSEEKE